MARSLEHPSRRDWWRLARMAFVVLLLLISAPGPVSFVAGASCEEWTSRALDMEVPEIETVLAREVKVRRVSSLPASFAGYTISANDVLLAREADYVVLAHELAHTAQIEQDGLVRWSARYAREWYLGMWHGCSVSDARNAVSYERTAELVEHEAEHRYLSVELWERWEKVVVLPEYVRMLRSREAFLEPDHR